MSAYSTDQEPLEVVDDRDNVIGLAPRAEIHAKGLLHRAVHIFVFNSRGEVYVQRRSPAKDRFPSLLDSSAAGHVDPGESYHAAALRELGEELGIRAPLKEVLRVKACTVTDNEHVVLYSAVTDEKPVPNPEEVQWGGFMNPEALSASMARTSEDFVPAFVHLWHEYQKGPH